MSTTVISRSHATPSNTPDPHGSSPDATRFGDGPVFILAPPRSYTSVVCAAVGQHPQLYGFPETHLFEGETLAELWSLRTGHWIRDGLLRVVAELFFGGQSEEAVTLARGWLHRRSLLNTGYIFELLIEKIHPLIPVEKSPDLVCEMRSMQRILHMFPNARFIHLLRHPRGFCESNATIFRAFAERGELPASHWAYTPAGGAVKEGRNANVIDPQIGWFRQNRNICELLAPLPPTRWMRLRGEDFLRNPREHLAQIAAWLGCRTDDAAIEAMLHPECSPYAKRGPTNARLGNSRKFLEKPELRPFERPVESLDGPLSWLDGAQEFLPRVRKLAKEFGYE